MRTLEERNKFIEQNLGLIPGAIKRCAPTYMTGLTTYDDLYQIASEALIRAADAYEDEKAAFSTFAYTAIHNALINAFQKEARATTHLVWTDEPLDEIGVCDSTEELVPLLKKTLLKMRETSKGATLDGIEAIELLSQGYSYTEIAKTRHSTPEKVKSHIFIARRKIESNKEICAILSACNQ